MLSLPRPSLSIHHVLLADAGITGATALLMLVGAFPLAELLDLPIGLLVGAGAVLIPYVGFLSWLATHYNPPRTAITAVISANIAWAAGCIGLLLSDQVAPNTLGVAFVLLQGAAVLVFADLQIMARRVSAR